MRARTPNPFFFVGHVAFLVYNPTLGRPSPPALALRPPISPGLFSTDQPLRMSPGTRPAEAVPGGPQGPSPQDVSRDQISEILHVDKIRRPSGTRQDVSGDTAGTAPATLVQVPSRTFRTLQNLTGLGFRVCSDTRGVQL